MHLHTIQQEKKAMEEKIAALVVAFQEKTGLNVGGILIHNSNPKRLRRTRTATRAKAEVSI